MIRGACSTTLNITFWSAVVAVSAFGQSITVTAPAANQAISGTSFTLRVSLSSAPSVVKVAYTCDSYPCYNPGIDAPTTLGVSNTPPFSYDFNSYWYLNGPHQLVATAYDALGHAIATSNPVAFTTANNWPVRWSPTLTVRTSTPVTSNWAGTVTVTGTLSGSGAGTDTLVHNYFVDGIKQSTINGTAATQTASLLTTQFPDGPHNVCLEVNDSSAPFIVPNGQPGRGNAKDSWAGAAAEWCRTVTFANGATPMAALVNAHEVFLKPGQTFQLSARILNTDGSTTAVTPVYQVVTPGSGEIYNQGPGTLGSGTANLLAGVVSVSSSGLVTAHSIGAALINVMVPTTKIIDLTATNPFGQLKSSSHPFTQANTGQLLNIISGREWTPGAYQITLASSGSAVPVGSPAKPGNTTNVATATIGPTRQVWIYVNPENATPAPCYGQDGSIQTSYTSNCMFVNSMFNSFSALQNEQPYGAALTSPLSSPGAGAAADWDVSGFNTIEFNPLPAGMSSLTGTEKQADFETSLSNYISGNIEGSNGLRYHSKFRGLAIGNGVFSCPQAMWAIAYGNESTWTPLTGLQYFIRRYMETGNVLGVSTVDEISSNCGFTPLQGPLIFSPRGTNQSALESIVAIDGHCAATLSTNSPPITFIADRRFIITGSRTPGMNSVAPAVYGLLPGGSGASATATVSGGGNTITVTVTNGGSTYWVAPIVNLSGGAGTYTSATATVNSRGQVTAVIVNGASGYWSPPAVTFSTSNSFHFSCPSVANGTYDSSNDPGLTVEPYGDVWYAGNTSWLKYDSWARIWTQMFAIAGRKFFIQNPGIAIQPPLGFANWGGNPHYPGAQAIGPINSVADSGDLYVPYGPGAYIASREPANGLLATFMHGYWIRSLYGAYDPSKPFMELTEATTSYAGLQGYRVAVASCSGNTIRFSAPHRIVNIIPGISRLSIAGATDGSGATDSCNNNFIVLGAPTPTTLTVLLGVTNFSGSATGGAATTQDGTTISLSSISAAGVPSVDASQFSANAGGFLAGDKFTPSVQSASNNRKRGQSFMVSGVSGATRPTSACLVPSNCSFSAAHFLILPENLELSNPPPNRALFYREIPALNATGGTAQILPDFRYHHGVSGSAPLTHLNPGFAFGSFMECLLEHCEGQRVYKIMTGVNDYSNQYGFMSGGTVGNIGWLGKFPDARNDEVSTQLYMNAHFENGHSVPTFWALSNGGLMASRLAKYLLQPSLNSPDCGMLIECAARAGSYGDLFFAFNATDGPQTPTFSLTPYLQKGQRIIRYVVNDHSITLSILSARAAGPTTDSLTLQPEDAVFYVFPLNFAGELQQPTISAHLSDVPNAAKIVVRYAYAPYYLDAAGAVADCGAGRCTPAWDRNIGTIYYRVIYLDSSSRVLATSDVQSF